MYKTHSYSTRQIPHHPDHHHDHHQTASPSPRSSSRSPPDSFTITQNPHQVSDPSPSIIPPASIQPVPATSASNQQHHSTTTVSTSLISYNNITQQQPSPAPTSRNNNTINSNITDHYSDKICF